MTRQIPQFLKSVVFWLLLASFFKQILWMGLTPVWHFPDEEAHFAQIQNTAEFGLNYPEITSHEIAVSDRLLNLNHNENRVNLFILDSSFKINYSDSLKGMHEDELNSLDRSFSPSSEIKLITTYPFLYYWLSGQIYRPVKEASLIDRVFIMRFIAVVISLATVYICFKIGELIFGKNSPWAAGLAFLISFQPMFSYMGAAINSDGLHIFWITLLIYGCLLQLKNSSVKAWGIITISLALGMITKQQMLIGVIAVLPILILALKKIKTTKNNRLFYLLSSGALGLLLFAAYLGNVRWALSFLGIDSLETIIKNTLSPDIFKYLGNSFIRTYREFIPWYWGTFRWVHVNLPRWTNRVQMAILAFSLSGLVIYYVKVYLAQKKALFKTPRFKITSYCLYISFFYYFSILLWDYQHFKMYGNSFGIQGRYFMPTIAAHMILIMFGLTEWGKLVFRKKVNMLIIALLLWWLVLQITGIYTLASIYYDLSSVEMFIIQASQYKPAIFKGSFWLVWIGIYALCLLVYKVLFISRAKSEISSENKLK
jgi:hypothetical protein